MCAPGYLPSWVAAARCENLHSTQGTLGKQEMAMKPGDHVKIIGRDGFYVFLKEVQGTATLRLGTAKSPDEPTVAIPINQIVSLEHTR